jgi:uncharacterized protein YjbJ (UPF0337 family)
MYANAPMNAFPLPSMTLSASQRQTQAVHPPYHKESIMNKDQVQGTAKNFAGIVQEETGKLIGSKTQQLKGLQKQVQGKADVSLGNAEEVIQDVKKTLKHLGK